MARSRAVLALVLAAGLCGMPVPTLHVHVDHGDHAADHHRAPLVHSHFGTHHDGATGTSTLEDHDAAAVYLYSVAAIQRAAQIAPPAVAPRALDSLSIPAQSPTASWLDSPIASVHDPPFSKPALRGPPLSPDLI